MSSVKHTLIFVPFPTVALQESDTRKVVLGPRLKNTSLFDPFISIPITQLQDRNIFVFYLLVFKFFNCTIIMCLSVIKF